MFSTINNHYAHFIKRDLHALAIVYKFNEFLLHRKIAHMLVVRDELDLFHLNTTPDLY